MNANGFCRTVAIGLLNHAARVLPAERAEWARAMAHELDHIGDAFEALRWSLGCVMASYLMRIDHMMRVKFDVPHWLLSLEVLVCLGPLTLLWLAAMYVVLIDGASGARIVVPTIIGTLGPLSLLLALRVSILRRRVPSALFVVLAVSFAALSVIQLIEPDVAWFAFQWRVWMLNSILPAMACAHLALIANAGPVSAHHHAAA